MREFEPQAGQWEMEGITETGELEGAPVGRHRVWQ